MLSIDLPPDQHERLLEASRTLGVDPQDLARAAVLDLLARPAADLEKAVEYVLDKNRTLYHRLS